jgi:two-component sensor histidine kinase
MKRNSDVLDDAARLSAVRRYDVLDTPPDGAFDRVTELAADLFAVPVSIISVVDHDRIWFKSHHGVDVREIGRDPGLCASAILQNEAWLVEDARSDPRTLANPLVAGAFGLRFYLGVPLRTHDGFNLGTLCVIDREPRTVDQRQIDQLSRLASLVMDQLELRLSARRAVSELSIANAQKDESLRRQALMIKEIDHRVKNSLSLVSSLLSLQSRNVPPQISKHIDVAARRLSSVARAHEHIYTSTEVQTVNVRRYLERLADDLQDLLPEGEASKVVVTSPDLELSSARIVAIGLVVNELVTNAVKHGANQVAIDFRFEGDDRVLSVINNGSALPSGFDMHTCDGLGLKVVNALAQQFGMSVTCENSARGVVFALRAPSSSCGAAQDSLIASH